MHLCIEGSYQSCEHHCGKRTHHADWQVQGHRDGHCHLIADLYVFDLTKGLRRLLGIFGIARVIHQHVGDKRGQNQAVHQSKAANPPKHASHLLIVRCFCRAKVGLRPHADTVEHDANIGDKEIEGVEVELASIEGINH